MWLCVEAGDVVAHLEGELRDVGDVDVSVVLFLHRLKGFEEFSGCGFVLQPVQEKGDDEEQNPDDDGGWRHA